MEIDNISDSLSHHNLSQDHPKRLLFQQKQSTVIQMAISFTIITLITTTLTLTNKIYHLDEKNYPTYDCIKMEYHNTGLNRTYENSCENINKYMIPDDYFLSICKKNQTIQIDIRQLIDDKPTKNGILLNQRQWEYIQRLRQLINQHIRRTNILWMK
jgi:hypothetical protein